MCLPKLQHPQSLEIPHKSSKLRFFFKLNNNKISNKNNMDDKWRENARKLGANVGRLTNLVPEAPAAEIHVSKRRQLGDFFQQIVDDTRVLKENLGALEAELGQKRDDLSLGEKDLALSRARVEALLTQLETISSGSQNLGKELQQINEDLAGQQVKNREGLGEVGTVITAIRDVLATISTERQSLAKRKGEVKSRAEELAGREADLRSRIERMGEFHDRSVELDEREADLQSRIDRQKTIEDIGEEARRDLDAQQASLGQGAESALEEMRKLIAAQGVIAKKAEDQVDRIADEQNSIQVARAALVKAKDELREAQDQNHQFVKDHQLTSSRVSELEGNLEAEKDRVGRRNETIAKLGAESATVKQSAEALRGELEEARGQLRGAREQLAGTKAQLGESREQLKKTDGQLEESQELLMHAKEQLGRADESLKETQGRLGDTKQQLKETQKELSDAKEQLGRADGSLEETQGKLKETQRQLKETQKALSEAEKRENSLFGAHSLLAGQLESQRKDGLERYEELLGRFSELDLSPIESGAQGMARATKTIEETSRVVEGYKTDLIHKLGRLKAWKEEHDRQMAELTQERAAQEERIDLLVFERDVQDEELGRLQQELSQLREVHKGTTGELEEQVADQTARAVTLEGRLRELGAEHLVLTQECSVLDGLYDHAMEELEAQGGRGEEALASLRLLVEERDRKVAELNKKANGGAAELFAARSSHATSQRRVADLQGHLSDLQRQLDAEGMRAKDLTHSKASADRVVQTLLGEAEELRAENARLRGLAGGLNRLGGASGWDTQLNSMCDLFTSFVPVCEEVPWGDLLFHLSPVACTDKAKGRFVDFLGEEDEGIWYCFDSVYHNGHSHEASRPHEEAVCRFHEEFGETCMRMRIDAHTRELPTVRSRLVECSIE